MDHEGLLVPVYFEGDAAPVEVRDLTHLYCTDQTCDDPRKCHCLTSGLNCAEMCSCSDCGNQHVSTNTEGETDGDDDDVEDIEDEDD